PPRSVATWRGAGLGASPTDCLRQDGATWYVRVACARTEDNRWRRLVSSPDPQVRAARNPSARPARGPVVAVTGAASGGGALLTERLAASGGVKQGGAVGEGGGGGGGAGG